MNSATLTLLEEMSRCSHPKYAEFAASVLVGPDALPESDVQQVIDAYLNDPYLTR